MVNTKPKTAEQYIELVDQAIIEVTRRLNTQLPFSHMLAPINDTHRNGLNIDSDS
jgi:hypothetical protein